jgi:hypothetical protein
MPPRTQTPGSHAGSIIFSNIPGRGDQSPVLQGDVTVIPQQTVRELVADVHSPLPYYKEMTIPAQIKLGGVLTTDSLPWLSDVVGASVRIQYTNGRVVTATGVTNITNPIEKNTVQGTTNELVFACVSVTEG